MDYGCSNISGPCHGIPGDEEDRSRMAGKSGRVVLRRAAWNGQGHDANDNSVLRMAPLLRGV